MKYLIFKKLIQKSTLLLRNFLLFFGNNKQLIGAVVLLAVMGVFGVSQTVHANVLDLGASIGSDFVRAIIEAVSRIAVTIARLCVLMAIFFLRFFINIAAYNGYIEATTVQLGWTMVRDVANMFFVVALMAIAFMTILGAGGYEWKKAMGKLIFGAIFINFSNLICGIIIDAAYVFTITFLSAVVQAAGGNMIQMFSLDKVLGLVRTPADAGAFENLRLELLASSFIMVLFGALAAYTIGAYAIVMVSRMVVLWTLIILSPLAFLAQAFPKGERVASRWWGQFINHVMVGPIMVFFLWLSFATLGNGTVFEQDIRGDIPPNIPALNESVDAGTTNALSLTEISSWENMANFIIAIAFLLVGIKVVGELNVQGGGVTAGAAKFAKNVATIATGVALARGAASAAGGFAKATGLKAGKAAAVGIGLKTGIPQKAYGMYAKASIWNSERKQKNDRKAIELEKAGKKGFKSWWYSSNDRGRKTIEDWGRAAKAAKQVQQDEISASHTPAGQAKDLHEFRLKITGEKKAAKGAQKEAERRAEMAAGERGKYSTEFNEQMATMSGSRVKQAAAERKLSEATEALQTEEKEKLAAIQRDRIAHDARLKGVDDDQALQMEEAAQAFKRAGEGRDLEVRDTERESRRAELQHEETMRTADEKDALAEKKSALDHLVKMDEGSIAAKDRLAQQEERQKQELADAEHAHAKEGGFMLDGLKARSQEQAAALQHERDTDSVLSELKAILENSNEQRGIDKTRNDADKRAELYRSQGDIGRAEAVISNALTQIAKQQQDLFSTMSYEQKMMMAKNVNQMIGQDMSEKQTKDAIQRSMGLMTSLLNSGAETGNAGLSEALKAAGWKEDVNDENRARALYSAILGRVVNKGDEGTAISNINNAYKDEQSANAAMRLMSDATKKFADDGMASFAGIIGKREETDPDTGRTRLRYEARASQDVGSANYFAERQKISNLTSLAGYANTDVSGKVTGFSDERIDQIGNLVQGMNKLGVSRIPSSVINSLNTAKINHRSDSRSYVKLLRKIYSSVEGTEAGEAFLKRASGMLDKIAAANGKSVDQIKRLVTNPPSRS